MLKNGFFTFCFSFIPGAGAMYQCYMKRGLSTMMLFALNCVATWLISVAGFFLPIIWFFSFFDTWSLRTQLKLGVAGPDKFLFFGDNSALNADFLKKPHKYIGIGFIIVGVYLILRETLVSPFYSLMYNLRYTNPQLAEAIDSFIGSIPVLLVSIVIIWLGIRLIRGKKVPVIQEDDYVAYARAEQNSAQQNADSFDSKAEFMQDAVVAENAVAENNDKSAADNPGEDN